MRHVFLIRLICKESFWLSEQFSRLNVLFVGLLLVQFLSSLLQNQLIEGDYLTLFLDIDQLVADLRRAVDRAINGTISCSLCDPHPEKQLFEELSYEVEQYSISVTWQLLFN